MSACLLEGNPGSVLADPHSIRMCRGIPGVSLMGGSTGCFQRGAGCFSLYGIV